MEIPVAVGDAAEIPDPFGALDLPGVADLVVADAEGTAVAGDAEAHPRVPCPREEVPRAGDNVIIDQPYNFSRSLRTGLLTTGKTQQPPFL